MSLNRFFGVLAALAALCSLSIGAAQAACPYDSLCGPRSLAEVCRRLGVRVSTEELVELSGCDKNGSNMAGLLSAATAKGLAAVGMKMGVDELFETTVPAIAHLWGDHFVVIQGVDASTIKLLDLPAAERNLRKQHFAKIYSGFVMFVARDQSLLPNARTRVASAANADLRFDSYVWSYGTVTEGSVVEYVFKYRNVGDSDLIISKVTPSCSCVTCSEYTDKIAPGGVGQLKAVFNSAGWEKATDKAIVVESNDSVTPIVVLNITGYVKALTLGHAPLTMDFGQLRKTESSVRQVYVPRSEEDPGAVDSVSCDIPWVKPVLLLSEDKNMPGTLVRLTWTSGAPVGVHKGTLKIVSAEPGRSVEVPLAAVVKANIHPEFDTFFFGFVHKGTRPTVKVELLSAAGPIVVTKVDYPRKLVKVQVETHQQRAVISATLKRNAPTGLIKGNIVIHTSDREQPQVTIPLCGYVK
ncbi:MAG: cysteine peptidase family C39 domain-containing protein [Armatimonadota bacterium]|nr:cysteine peptidase family C39 domain-containing protein [Armatimonadota bacterium]